METPRGLLTIPDALAEIRRHIGADDADPRAADFLRRALENSIAGAALADGCPLPARHWRNGDGAATLETGELPAVSGGQAFYIPEAEWNRLRGRLGPDRAEQLRSFRRPTLSLNDLARLSKIARPDLESIVSPLNSRLAEMKTAIVAGKLPATRLNRDRLDQLAEVKAGDFRAWAATERIEWAIALGDLWAAHAPDGAALPEAKRKPRQTRAADDAALRARIELVHQEARKRWPNKTGRPAAWAMAHRLSEPQRRGFSVVTVYQILANKYPAAKRLGLKFD